VPDGLSSADRTVSSRQRAFLNDAVLVGPTRAQQQPVEVVPTGHLGDRDEVIPAEITHLPFHAPFLMALGRRAERGLELPVRTKRDKARRFLPLVATENLLDRAGQIVVAQPSKYPTKIMKGVLVRVQKGLLGGARIGAMKRGPTGHASHHEHLRHLTLAGQINGRLIPVHLAFNPPVIALRDKDLGTE